VREIEPNIYLVEDLTGLDSEQISHLGYYFSNEAQMMEGPFGTIEECRENLSNYVRDFLK